MFWLFIVTFKTQECESKIQTKRLSLSTTVGCMANLLNYSAFKLTEAQINEYTKAFNDFDQDGDGHLSCEELGVIMRSIGHNPSPKELQEMMTVADRDASGTIDLLEFLEIMAKKSEEDSSEQDLKEAFSLFDKNGNGVISADELKFVLSGMGCELSDDAAEEMIKQADIDGDGGINFEEFLRLLKDRNEQS
ncbi:calmodulin-A-like isoform X2 [Actinia tenebrosa]|uniref:Calmodulin-A-like isoform X2 n=1 Tax=Actinia tenebrosa TaxID=6105 RepID=A0A6P8HRC3_ACTTE|nr:calmodulin-A-like isoform X2 [Actinia tenebrosa]